MTTTAPPAPVMEERVKNLEAALAEKERALAAKEEALLESYKTIAELQNKGTST